MPSASRARRKKERWRRRAEFFGWGPCGCWCQGSPNQYYYGAGARTMMCVFATLSTAVNPCTVWALDANGNLLWSYPIGQSSFGVDKNVYGITRDDSGNVYLAYWAFKASPPSTAFGIQKLDQNGNLLQDWTPSGWTLSSSGWAPTTVNGLNAVSSCLDYANGKLYWQHVGRLNGGVKYDCISVLDAASFTELASYGGSNFSPLWTSSVGTTPSTAGKIRVDPNGDIWNEFTPNAPSQSNACLCKISAAGSLVFNHQTTQPIQTGGWNYTINPQRTNNGFFTLNPDNAPAHGWAHVPVCPDWTNDCLSDPSCLHHDSGGLIQAWCKALFDGCNSHIALREIDQMTLMVTINSATVNNTAGQAPVWQKSMCDLTTNQDRVVAAGTDQNCLGACYGNGKLFFSYQNSTMRFGTYLPVLPCHPSGLQGAWTNNTLNAFWGTSGRSWYGLGTFDAGTGAQLALRDTVDIGGGRLGNHVGAPSDGNVFVAPNNVYGLESLTPAGIIVGSVIQLLPVYGTFSFTPQTQFRGFSVGLSDLWHFAPQPPAPSVQPVVTASYADRH